MQTCIGGPTSLTLAASCGIWMLLIGCSHGDLVSCFTDMQLESYMCDRVRGKETKMHAYRIWLLVTRFAYLPKMASKIESVFKGEGPHPLFSPIEK